MQKLLSLFLLCTVFNFSFAQRTVTKTYSKPYKPPTLTTSLSQYKDTLQKISIEEAHRIFSLPLQIIDNQKVVYAISSYQFIYKKLNVSEDENGKKYIKPSMTAQTFKSTPISPIWISNIKDQLKSGEILWFTDVIVKDNKGRVMFAPDLKFMIL